MKNFFVVAVLVALISCKNAKLRQYEKTIAEADSFSVHYRESNEINAIDKDEIAAFKEVFIRDIKPEPQRTFMYDIEIRIYRNHEQTAGLMICANNKGPFANYQSQNLTFGFRLTYRMGMFFDYMKH